MHQGRDVLLGEFNYRYERALEECRHDRSQVRTDLPVLAVHERQGPRYRIERAWVRRTDQIPLLFIQALDDGELEQLRCLVLRYALDL